MSLKDVFYALKDCIYSIKNRIYFCDAMQSFSHYFSESSVIINVGIGFAA